MNGYVCQILEVPWLSHVQFRIDWLHCSDQGVGADALGNVFKVLASKQKGRNKTERVHGLWRRVQRYYSENKVADKLPKLTVEMIQQSGKPPKLRGSAGCVRALVPCADMMCKELLSSTDPVESAIKSVAATLCECYENLSSAKWDEDALPTNAIKFAHLYVALERHATACFTKDSHDWHIKPKMHMFLELCAEGSMPSKFWCYRDEDYGGTVAALAHHRGGPMTAHGMSVRVLDFFKVKQQMVRIMQ